MDKIEFKKLGIEDKVKYLNNKLSQGQTVTSIREDLGIKERTLQKEIKKGGYKFIPKSKRYVKTTEITTTATDVVIKPSTSVVDNNIGINKEYILENIEILKEMIEKYKNTRATTTATTSIVIDLLNDKHLNPKPHSLRINEFVWNDWQKFCDKNKYYSKQDLLSMALKEYIEKYGD